MRLSVLLALSLLPLTLYPTSTQAEHRDYILKQWDQDDGLPLITVKAIHQARDGHLWLGTWDGISRFDGIDFTNYMLVDHPELVSANIQAFAESPNRDLWVGTHQSLARLRQGDFEVFGAAKGLENSNILSLLADPEGVLWVGTASGLYQESGDQFSKIAIPGADAPSIHAIHQGKTGLWIGSSVGLHFLATTDSDPEAVFTDQGVGLMCLDAEDRPVLRLVDDTLVRLSSEGRVERFGSLAASCLREMTGSCG